MICSGVNASSSLVNVAKKSHQRDARKTRAVTCKRTFEVAAHKNFFIANSTNLKDPVEGAELSPTEAVENALLEESAFKITDSLLSVPTNLNHATWTFGVELSLRDMSWKLTMLLALLSGQRVQTLKALTLTSMTLTANKCVFTIDTPLKTTRPGKHLGRLEFLAYEPDRNLCVVQHLQDYIGRTSHLRGEADQLLIGYQKPHKPVSTNTIARWLKNVMAKAGIDTSVYKAHSTRAAVTSAAKGKQVPIDTILSTAGWSSESTFARFYDKPIQDTAKNFGHELLHNSC